MSKYNPINTAPINIGIEHSVLANKDNWTFPVHLGMLNPTGHAGSLFMLSEMLGSGTVDNTSSKYDMQKAHFPAFCVTEDAAGSACKATTTLKADQLNGILPNQVLMVECTGEQMLVVSVPSDNTVVVQRGMGYSDAKPMRANDRITVIGTAFEESSLRPQSVSMEFESIDFTTQIFRNTWSLSQTANCVNRAGRKPARVENFQTAAYNHMRDIEMSLWFGERTETFRNGQPLRKMDGFDALVHKHAPENVHFASATTNWKQLETMLASVSDGGTPMGFVGAEPVLIGGRKVLGILNDIVRLQGNVQFDTGQTSFGFKFTSITTSYGTYHFMYNPLFDTSPYMSNTLRIVNLPSLMIKYLCDRRTQHHAFNIDESGKKQLVVDHGIDAMGGSFLSELTLHMVSPKSNGIIYGLCAAGCNEPCVFTGWSPREMIKDDCGRLRPNFDLDGDGRKDHICGANACIPNGIPYPERPAEPEYDKCGNLVPPIGLENKFECACYATEVEATEAVSSISTSCGTITFAAPVTDWSNAAQVNAAIADIDTFLAANGGGSAAVSLVGSTYIIKIADTTCRIEMTSSDAVFSVV